MVIADRHHPRMVEMAMQTISQNMQVN